MDVYKYLLSFVIKKASLFRLMIFMSFLFVTKKLFLINTLDAYQKKSKDDALPFKTRLSFKTVRLNNDMDNQIVNFFQIKNSSEIDPLVNLHRYKFHLTSPLCGLLKPDIVVFIHTAIQNVDRRQVIRNTWVKYTRLNNITISTVFMLGEANTHYEKRRLDAESKIHGDIVQGNFVDNYLNLTYKHIMGIQWVLSECPTAKMFVKLDDDVLLNVFNLVEFVATFGYQTDLLYCSVLRKSGVHREKRKKWYVSREIYPFEHYPDYCSGMAYLMSPDVARRIYGASKDTRFYWVDDVYVTGILAAKVGQSLTWPKEGHSTTQMRSYHRANMHDYMFLLGTQLWSVLWKALLVHTPERLTKQVHGNHLLSELRKKAQ